jgi:iron-sulfur cluster repair protein YtfE (RIC family)
MTPDLFSLPHKALRTYVGLIATRLGALDTANARAIEQLGNDLHSLIDELEAHGAHEDDFILPLLDRRLPDLAGQMRLEHTGLTEALAGLHHSTDLLAAEPGIASQLALYRQLRRFEAINIRHLDFEETIVMPALWIAAPQAELAGVLTAFKAAHPEAAELYRRAPEALTPAEKALVGVQD